ncbi:cation:proton antiporter [Paenarthrobacter sp. NPDC056912]|uniref:cation:proton antiporter n=1 Tax=Paenarthrobacter sp. NPDC056912 TaxID=3345965 RepID=UPI00366AA4A8
MESIALLFVIGVLLVIGGSWIAPRIGVAAPIILVLVGIGCSIIPGQEPLEIEPEWILAVVLPPILYAAAVNVPITDFKRNFRAISGLSVTLVALSAVAVGFLLTWLIPGLPLAAGIALGAVVSPPDAVAATSIGKRLGLPSRLVTVLEGEGLLNDATALVIMRAAIAAIGGTVTLGSVAGGFVLAVALGVGIGLVVGVATVWARGRIGQPTLTTAISFVVPFLAFLPAEAVHASGVLAVVVAGLVTGFKSARHLTAQDRISERMNWRTIQLLLENGVFLVMGYQMTRVIEGVEKDHLSVWGAVGVGLLVVVALLVIRGVFMVPLIFSLRRQQRRATRMIARADDALIRIEEVEKSGNADARRTDLARRHLDKRRADWQMLSRDGLGWRGGAVLTWSGMRGVVTLAAAQSLPLDVPFRSELILIAFTVAVVTLLLHGMTLPLVIRLLGVRADDRDALQVEISELVEQIVAAGAQQLSSPELTTPEGKPYSAKLIAETTSNRRRLADAYTAQFAAVQNEEQLQRGALFRIMIDAEQAALLDARASGRYSSHTLELGQMVIDADAARMAQRGIVG